MAPLNPALSVGQLLRQTLIVALKLLPKERVHYVILQLTFKAHTVTR